MRRIQGRPLDWIDRIARIFQAKRFFRGNTMYLVPTKTADEQDALWTLTSDTLISDSFSSSEDLSDYRNQVRVVRSSSNGGKIGEGECEGYHCPGRTGQAKFDGEYTDVYGIAEVRNGIVTEFVYLDKLGAPVLDNIGAVS